MSNQDTINAVDAELLSRFDQIAGNYDAERCHSYAGVFINEVEAYIVRKWALGGIGTKGLDIPCGTGRLTISLANRCEKVIAGDISAKMLAITREKTRCQGFTNVTFQRVNGRNLPFADSTFDTIICFSFFHLIPNDQKDKFMAEFARVLKPGGKLILELKSPFYGLFLALLRYRRRLGEIPRRCFFPGRGRWLFRGYRKGRVLGTVFPLLWALTHIFGMKAMIKISSALGRIPVFQFLAYAIVFELYNEKK